MSNLEERQNWRLRLANWKLGTTWLGELRLGIPRKFEILSVSLMSGVSVELMVKFRNNCWSSEQRTARISSWWQPSTPQGERSQSNTELSFPRQRTASNTK